MRRRFIALGLTVTTFLTAAPLVGWPPVVRLSAVLVVVLLLSVILIQPWRWPRTEWQRAVAWEPSRGVLVLVAVGAALLLSWIVLSLFKGGHINAVDFTVYYDRPLYRTVAGYPLYVETTNEPPFEHLTHLAVHAYWILLPLSVLYRLHASPLWLLALSVIAVVAGSVHLYRIGRRLGFGGALAMASMFALLFNDNTARTLRYGFHPEVLYAWFVPWLLDAGLHGSRAGYLFAAVCCLLVKEDAILPLFAAVVALALVRGRSMTVSDRLVFLMAPIVLALANLLLFYGYVVPALSPSGTVMYSNFWENYGPTPVMALRGIVLSPSRVACDLRTSGLLRVVLPPFLFLPLIGWRWSVGTLPIAIIFGASANEQVRGFGIYYAICLVPFLVLAGSSGALTLTRRFVPSPTAPLIAALVVVLGSMLVGRGYSLRPWRSETAAVMHAVQLLSNEPVILVQSGLYPHAGYDPRVQLLTPHALRNPANTGAAMVLADRISSYPLRHHELRSLLRLPTIRPMPGGLVAVRNQPPP